MTDSLAGRDVEGKRGGSAAWSPTVRHRAVAGLALGVAATLALALLTGVARRVRLPRPRRRHAARHGAGLARRAALGRRLAAQDAAGWHAHALVAGRRPARGGDRPPPARLGRPGDGREGGHARVARGAGAPGHGDGGPGRRCDVAADVAGHRCGAVLRRPRALPARPHRPPRPHDDVRLRGLRDSPAPPQRGLGGPRRHGHRALPGGGVRGHGGARPPRGGHRHPVGPARRRGAPPRGRLRVLAGALHGARRGHLRARRGAPRDGVRRAVGRVAPGARPGGCGPSVLRPGPGRRGTARARAGGRLRGRGAARRHGGGWPRLRGGAVRRPVPGGRRRVARQGQRDARRRHLGQRRPRLAGGHGGRAVGHGGPVLVRVGARAQAHRSRGLLPRAHGRGRCGGDAVRPQLGPGDRHGGPGRGAVPRGPLRVGEPRAGRPHRGRLPAPPADGHVRQGPAVGRGQQALRGRRGLLRLVLVDWARLPGAGDGDDADRPRGRDPGRDAARRGRGAPTTGRRGASTTS